MTFYVQNTILWSNIYDINLIGANMNRVKEFRKRLGISQLELAKDIGVSRQTINMIENDKYNPTLELCLNLARSLQTDLNSLFWEDDF